ncbi:MAG: hypothetical protein UT19_C0007G0085 [Candidatus Woesebacteria bacterium GW2011_GWB1_39_10b]|uniref:DUF4352 domain-containing protein n=3 Tax=Candidatus Woeseibacteriota TaxID=1752722 RepID=A0A0G0NAT6_9BACT|nr:MAG: hypothetical protein US72_C0008G0042 [Microgenomates group bacterium GW2011_GWC1_38_12]KKQ93841.1 MAG: hypothetical protein UT19_C0007G0085 [Candidatus Woesebacteria bacterium GW2011_GWB1_39_10b]KKR13259.1 MAG: hypothetical protein UT40_C0021G0041 [Candidatus Woesebacteria bacterium GW2011_GWA1_39_21b]OGM64004.1 MAG: hypothetical protein A3A52_04960 [Candidatus Woesebacteria bacterium RIFCSPLOWO2_01_FULL_39_14]
MNTKIIVIVGIILVIVVIGSFISRKKEIPQGEVEQKQIQNTLSPQTNSEGSVEVEVIPVEISDTSDLWQFKIVLNTHSVELDQDLTKITLLVDDKGNEYQSLSWEGAPPGGHHREGVLTFDSISPQPSSIELVVRDIDGIEERKFSWNL